MIEPKFRWRLPQPVSLEPEWLPLGARFGASRRLMELLAGRGLAASEFAAFLGEPRDGLHDPRLLPDADAALRRLSRARARGERVLVYGDFDADGLTGLAILVLALRAAGIDAAPYVPERLGDGHGLSTRAVDLAVSEGRSLIVTADCGTTSGPEIAAARGRGVETIVTDHHHASTWPDSAVATVNPQRPDSVYPEHRLTGAGVAWKLSALLLAEFGATLAAADLADLALIGTVADVAPILGENRCLARLGLELIRAGSRPGIAALLRAGRIAPPSVDLDTIGFAIAPRLNAAGRVGEAARAARLLLSTDAAEADVLAAELELANLSRRDLTTSAVAQAQASLAASESDDTGSGAIVMLDDWPVGIIGLVAGRLAEEHGRPAVVATLVEGEAGVLRASCRSPRGFDLAAALVDCADLMLRHGGHAAAAGFELPVERWPEFEARFRRLVQERAAIDAPAELAIDLAVAAASVDYPLVHELSLLEPSGPGNPRPLVGIGGLTVSRVRPAAGGHTQLVLKRERDVLDGIAFRRADLGSILTEGDRVDVVAHVVSRSFGGFESLQLEVRDVASSHLGLLVGRHEATQSAVRVHEA